MFYISKKISGKYGALLVLIGLIVTNIISAQQAKTDTLKLFYEINEKQLNSHHTRLIDSALAMKSNTYYKIEILSYTDYLATNEFNKILSSDRAKNVQDYLLKKGVKSATIQKCEGKGEIELTSEIENKAGIPSNRRTEIIFKYKTQEPSHKPDLVSEIKPALEVIKDTVSVKAPAMTIDNINTLDTGQTLVLQNLNFYPSSHYFLEESEKELKKLLAILKENPKLKIEIQGHITAECPECLKNKTNDSYDGLWGDWHLSRNRAEFIYDYLVKKGIDKTRMKFVGFGNTKPLVSPELTEEDRKKNRRVEIKVLEK
jgi:outer membrane protein OmpA-like peptidoglycan-associated protein